MSIQPIHFRAIQPEDLDHKSDPALTTLNDKFRELVDRVNSLLGANGPIQLNADLDLSGNRIKNVGAAVDANDALSTASADPKYGASVQQQNMEAVGTKMLQTTRRLNDGTQQHVISSDLNGQGSIPPTFVGAMTYASTPTSITWTWTGLTIQFADQSIIAVQDGNLVITGLVGGTTYYFYPYYDTLTGQVVFVADTVNGHGVPPVAFLAPNGNAAIVQNGDGRVPLSSGTLTAATPVSGTGGGGGGGGTGCMYGGMNVESKLNGRITIRMLELGEEIKSRNGRWTRVIRKKVGKDSTWVKVSLANGENIIVTPRDTAVLFDERTKPYGELCLEDMLRGIRTGREVPMQIVRLEVVSMEADWVLLSCYPDQEFLVGREVPSVFAHNLKIGP